MPPLINLAGKKFGKLVVLERAPNKTKHVMWKCQCECGVVLDVRGEHLRKGLTTTCGHCGEHPNKFIDITGQRFGKLVAIERSKEIDNQGIILWKCKCDCGATTIVRGINLRSGMVKSCGGSNCRGTKIDITGQRFGKLVVIKEADFRNDYNNNAYWECKCDCGNTTIVNGSSLRLGITSSCGCLASKGELKINELLNSACIKYKSQKTFSTCKFSDTNKLARFDFYIEKENYLIEFDGIQHFQYKENGTFWDTKEKFEKTQEHDAYKNQWCKENNIPLIRIPYTKLNTLCIEDLMLETTQFRVV